MTNTLILGSTVFLTVGSLGLVLRDQASEPQKAALAAPPVPQVREGKELFDYHCAACHGRGIGNPGHSLKPGTEALQVKYNGALSPALEDRTDLTPEAVAIFVRNGVSIMPHYRKTELSDPQLAAIGAFLSRNNPHSDSK